MAALIATIRLEGLDKCTACFTSIGEALDNAGAEDAIEIESFAGGLRHGQTTIVWMELQKLSGDHAFVLKPAPGMILFIGWLMTMLPSRATVAWCDGWPHVYCPPNDDRDAEDDPTPLVPDELIPV